MSGSTDGILKEATDTLEALMGLSDRVPHSHREATRAVAAVRATGDLFVELAGLSGRHFDQPEVQAAIDGIREGLRSLRLAARALIDDDTLHQAARGQLTASLPVSAAGLTRAVASFLRGVRRDADRLSVAVETLEPFEDRIAQQTLVDEVSQVRSEVDDALAIAQRTAGVASEGALSKHLEDLAGDEAKTADSFRTACVGTLVLVVVASGAAVVRGGIDDLTATTLIAHILLSLSLAAVAAYLGGQAASHRHLARWSRILAVQLSTIDGYSASLSESDRSALQLGLGKRVFMETLPDKRSSDPGLGLDEVADVLTKVTDLIGAVADASDTGNKSAKTSDKAA